MLGDACLVRVGDASQAIELGLRLTGEVARRHGFPDVRVGMHTGSAAQRGADWFGSTINIAARVAEIAGPCDVLLTSATREAAAALEGVDFDDRGSRELRHVAAPLHLYTARARGIAQAAERWVIDPVCRMRVDVEQASTSLAHEGAEFFFCSAICAGSFARSPERFVREAARESR